VNIITNLFPIKKQQVEEKSFEENVIEEQASSGGSSFVSYLIILAGLAIILVPIIFK
jgi:hypothetical protein